MAEQVVGIISLGLQVYDFLKRYLEDFKTKNEQVSNISMRLDQLKQFLDTIEAVRQIFEGEQREATAAVQCCLTSCREELDLLYNKLIHYENSAPINRKGKAKEVIRRLRFPLARPELVKLEEHLDRTLQYLGLAMSGMGL